MIVIYMQKKTILELEKEYNFEFEKIIKQIKTSKAKRVLLQFPDGLKPYATTIVDFLEEKTVKKVQFLIWMETCFGACDTPVLSKKIEKQVDLVIQFGHNEIMPKY
jgi:2-(3-amino-3-carboxypropyl)histidine synthase